MVQIGPPYSRHRMYSKMIADKRHPPAPDHPVLCPIDCSRPLDRCHCLRGMLQDRGLAAAPETPQPLPDWRPPHAPEPGQIVFEPDFYPGLAPLLIALALGTTAALSFAVAWWLA